MTGHCQASSGNDSVEYELLEEAPSGDLLVGRLSLDASYSGYTKFTFGLGLNVNARFSRFYLNGGFRVDPYRSNIDPTSPDVGPKGGVGPSMEFSAIGGYSLFQKTRKQTVGVSVDGKKGGDGGHGQLVPVASKVDDRANIEVGLQVGRTWYDLEEVDFEGRYSNFRLSDDQLFVTSLNYSTLRLGASFQRTYNTTIQSDEVGESSERSRIRFYGYLTIPFQQDAKPLYLRNGSFERKINVERNTERRPFGLVLGYYCDELEGLFKGPLSYGFGMRGGVFPGLKGSKEQNFFITGTWNVGFSSFLD